MEEYVGIIKERSLQRRAVLLAGAVLLVYMELKSSQWFFFPLTILLIAAIFLHKEHVVSEEGVDIRYYILSFHTVNRWKWEEITAMQPDFKVEAPNVKIAIEKNRAVVRPFVFSRDDYLGVLKLAKRMNPDIFIEYYTEEEREEIDEKNERYKEQMHAQQVQKKNAKKKRR